MTRFVAVLAVAVGLATGCDREPAPAPLASLALSYAAGPDAVAADAAVARAQAEVRRRPADADAYVALATTFVQRARWDRDPTFLLHARDALSAARTLGARGTAAAVAEIALLTEGHQFAEAGDAARRLIAAAPDEPVGHLLLGDAVLELGDVDGAAAAYQRAIDLRPALPSYERAAHIRWLDGDVDGAIELLQLALDAGSRRDPEPTAWCHVALGAIHWQRGALDAAAAATADALALVPDYPAARLLEARVALARGDGSAALTAIDDIPVRVRTVEDLSLRVDILRAIGRADDADAVARDLARRSASDPREVARFWARHGLEVERAQDLASRPAAERPTVDALAVLALAEGRAGNTVAARETLARARRLGTRDPRLDLYGAVIERVAGDVAAARRALEAALPAARGVDPVLVAELEGALSTRVSLERAP